MTARQRVLICDDEAQILRALRVILGDAGFEVVPAMTVREALDAVAVRPPDAAIIDLVLPDGDGVEVTSSIREWSKMPILVLSAVGDEREKVRALDAGADDYITKPFGPDELVARLRAALRRSEPSGDDEPVIEADGLVIDLPARRITRGGEEIHLTPTEYDLLRHLALNRGRLLTHQALLREVWGPGFQDDTQVLRVHIANLRRKIEAGGGAPRLIRTDPGVGYRFSRLGPAPSRHLYAPRPSLEVRLTRTPPSSDAWKFTRASTSRSPPAAGSAAGDDCRSQAASGPGCSRPVSIATSPPERTPAVTPP